MPRKSNTSRKPAVVSLACELHHKRAVAAPCTAAAEDKQLAEAIAASRAYELQNGACKTTLEQVLEFSRATAAAEAEEAEALRLAVEASLADSKQKELSLSLAGDAGGRRRPRWTADTLPISSDADEQAPDLSTRKDALADATQSVCSQASQFEEVAKAAVKAAAEATQAFCSQPSRIEEAAEDAIRRTLKVTCEHDTRRLRSEWSAGAPAHEILGSVLATIEAGFGLPSGSLVLPGYLLKYHDDEGDLCSLVEGTVMDFLDMSLTNNSLKIIMQKQADVKEGESLKDFTIATPPMSPRSCVSETFSQGIEDDYDSVWSLVEEKH